MTQNDILILITQGFEEEAVVRCLSQMRQASLPVSLVGLSAGLISSRHGLVMLPDYSLEQLSPVTVPKMVLIPGGRQCVLALLADPRVHKLLKEILEHGGYVASTSNAQSVLAEAGIPCSDQAANFFPQEGRKMDDYIKQLIYRMKG